jgi:uncharacterized protein
VILVDVNLLLYAGIEAAPEHERAKAWLDSQYTNGIRIGLPWHSILGYMRLATNRRVYPRGPSAGEAWDTVERWVLQPNAWIPEATDRHFTLLSQFVAAGIVSSALVSDAHLAALAIEHGLTLCSNDRDFRKFDGLRWLNPLDP